MLHFTALHIFPFLIIFKVHDIYKIIFKTMGVKSGISRIFLGFFKIQDKIKDLKEDFPDFGRVSRSLILLWAGFGQDKKGVKNPRSRISGGTCSSLE